MSSEKSLICEFNYSEHCATAFFVNGLLQNAFHSRHLKVYKDFANIFHNHLPFVKASERRCYNETAALFSLSIRCALKPVAKDKTLVLICIDAQCRSNQPQIISIGPRLISVSNGSPNQVAGINQTGPLRNLFGNNSRHHVFGHQ